jgi:PmbA protein
VGRHPVEENHRRRQSEEMFMNISEIANDLNFRGSMACPTLRIDGLIVGGE